MYTAFLDAFGVDYGFRTQIWGRLRQDSFSRKNFGYYDLLKSGTIADKLFTNALDVMTLVGLTTLDLSSAL